MTVRAMSKGDLTAVHEIECLSFRSPWSKMALRSELSNSVAHYLVLEEEGRVLGYCGMWVMLDEAHVTNLAVHPAARGKGSGRLLLRHCMEKAAALGATAMTLEVRESNRAAQQLYAGFGFERQGCRKGYYQDTGEDAWLFWNRDIGKTINKLEEL